MTSEKYYKIAYANYWLDNRQIIDATVDGKRYASLEKYQDVLGLL